MNTSSPFEFLFGRRRAASKALSEDQRPLADDALADPLLGIGGADFVEEHFPKLPALTMTESKPASLIAERRTATQEAALPQAEKGPTSDEPPSKSPKTVLAQRGSASQAGGSPAHLASPLFVVGSPRSGTSILTNSLLAAGYNGFREGNFLTLLRVFDSCTARHIKSFSNGSDKVMASVVAWDEFRHDISAAFKKQVDALNPVAPWMDKSGNPEMIEAIPDILKLWPTSIFIFAKRRAIENVTSRLRKFPGHSFEYHCKDWAKNMTAWREIRGRLEDRAIEIDQQEIIRSPGETALRLSDLIGCNPAGRAKIEAVFSADRPQQTENGSASRVIDLQDAGWSEPQVQTFLTCCWAEMQNFGYSLNQDYWQQTHVRSGGQGASQ